MSLLIVSMLNVQRTERKCRKEEFEQRNSEGRNRYVQSVTHLFQWAEPKQGTTP